MGSGEIYNAVETMPEVRDCLVVGLEQGDGGYWMPLFVALGENAELDDDLRGRIIAAIRTGASPRHVPDDIVVVPGIPRTMTGKRLEIPIKRDPVGRQARRRRLRRVPSIDPICSMSSRSMPGE